MIRTYVSLSVILMHRYVHVYFIYWFIIVFTGLYLYLLVYTCIYWFALVFTGLYLYLLVCTCIYWFVLVFTGLYLQ